MFGWLKRKKAAKEDLNINTEQRMEENVSTILDDDDAVPEWNPMNAVKDKLKFEEEASLIPTFEPATEKCKRCGYVIKNITFAIPNEFIGHIHGGSEYNQKDLCASCTIDVLAELGYSNWYIIPTRNRERLLKECAVIDVLANSFNNMKLNYATRAATNAIRLMVGSRKVRRGE